MYWNSDVMSEMNRLRREMDSLFSQYGNQPAAAATTYPLVNIGEDDERLVVSAELPGMTKEQVHITFSDGALTISGKREQPEKVSTMSAVRRERSEGAFEKSLRIPTKIDPNGITASFENGILTVTLKKSEEAKPKTITIEAK